MKQIFKRCAAIAAAAALTTMIFAGCKTSEKKQAADNSFTYWRELPVAAAAVVSNLGETAFAKKLQEKTGTKITYKHPPQWQTDEKFNLMIASKNLPDIIEYKWSEYPGGPAKAIKDGKIIALNSYIEKYAPELIKYLDEHEDVARLCKTDDGDIYAFPFIRGAEELCITEGLVIRKDWLEELNIDEPETIDEWENMLVKFKEAKKIDSPLDITPYPFIIGAFSGAYGTPVNYFAEDGKIKYGPYEAGFKDFVGKMSDWYSKGLITPDIASVENSVITSDLLSDKAGAVIGSLGGGMGTWLSQKPYDKFDLTGVKYPVLNKGDVPKFHSQQLACPGSFAAITTSCKNPDGAAKFLAYGYTEEGQMLFNFGIEGESYEMKNGYPTYTEKITKPSEGLSMANMLGQYCLSFDQGPFIQKKEYYEQYAGMPQQQDAWNKYAVGDGVNRTIPPLSYEESKSTELAKKQTAINTYVDEQLCKYIMGIEPMSDFDKFTSELEKLGIKDVLAAKQAAYEKYLKR